MGPSGVSPLLDGYQTLIEFSADPDVKMWEKSVTPPGIDGGEMVDTTTMRNEEWRTMAPRSLKSLTEGSFTAAYNPQAREQIQAMINVNQEITVTFSNGATETFWGVLRTASFNEITEGEQPTVEITLSPTNTDDTGAEMGPDFTESTTTTT